MHETSFPIRIPFSEMHCLEEEGIYDKKYRNFSRMNPVVQPKRLVLRRFIEIRLLALDKLSLIPECSPS
ncbi:hypothetical protein LEP1GSC047_0261 [Leptospira inadai serovar Lyme str. 10]|uniref:Uncharacterized protein n=2 Tax=Leptospira inadai serovar Lyme TaxID=293084 RepID=V6HHG3_9LEPT|nr:hypothetical protein LEP1GSC047_0261 [Leptospira inadai serovar Lyme str. 10]PNV76769.1 hypothetical protein BES34_000295 [Leptospira inadai serovar Lyme]